jgi:hypothetical protein
MNKKPLQLARLVNMNIPEAILEEVKNNFINFYDIRGFDIVRKAFKDMQKLFSGNYTGYRMCNTPYHDVTHISDVLLAFSRLVDGYNIKEGPLPADKVRAGLIATIMHDTGYIQQDSESGGTGAKYTTEHVQRSVEFLGDYGPKMGLKEDMVRLAMNMVKSTSLVMDIGNIEFIDEDNRILGYMLGSADLMGQMASRTYLEKLLFLYDEFQEASIPGYNSEFDLLKKTAEFYDSLVAERLDKVLEGVHRYSKEHFIKRYKVKQDLYTEAIEKQLNYLKNIIKNAPGRYKEKLRRTK